MNETPAQVLGNCQKVFEEGIEKQGLRQNRVHIGIANLFSPRPYCSGQASNFTLAPVYSDPVSDDCISVRKAGP